MAEFDDPGGDPVEEITVVGHEKTAAAVFGEELFNPLHRRDVEMVGRFVQQQQIGFGDDRPRQRDPAFFAAGKFVAGALRIAQPELRQNLFDLGIEVPAVVQHQQMVDFGVFRRVHRHGFKLLLELEEPRQPVAHIVGDGAAVVDFEILRQHRDAQIAGAGEVAGTGELFPGDQPQQR